MKLARSPQTEKEAISDRHDRDLQFLKGMENANSKMLNFT